MKSTLLLLLFFCTALPCFAQAPQTELYTLLHKLATDSNGYENVGNWAVGQPAMFPVKWQADRIEMSDDTSINFFRNGTARLLIKGKNLTGASPWRVMLKGPRSGYSSYSIVSPASAQWQPPFPIDSLLGGKPYRAKLLKKCDNHPGAGYYYYEVKMPQKDVLYLRIGWKTTAGATTLSLDGYDAYSKYAARLNCP